MASLFNKHYIFLKLTELFSFPSSFVGLLGEVIARPINFVIQCFGNVKSQICFLALLQIQFPTKN